MTIFILIICGALAIAILIIVALARSRSKLKTNYEYAINQAVQARKHAEIEMQRRAELEKKVDEIREKQTKTRESVSTGDPVTDFSNSIDVLSDIARKTRSSN